MPFVSLIAPNNLSEKPRQRGRSFHGVKPRSSSFSELNKRSKALSCIEITSPLRHEWKPSFMKNYETLPELPSPVDDEKVIDVRTHEMLI